MSLFNFLIFRNFLRLFLKKAKSLVATVFLFLFLRVFSRFLKIFNF